MCYHWFLMLPPSRLPSKQGDQILSRGSLLPAKAGSYFTCPHTDVHHCAQSLLPFLQVMLEHLVPGLTSAVPPVVPHAAFFRADTDKPLLWVGLQCEKGASAFPKYQNPTTSALFGNCRSLGRLQDSPGAMGFPEGKAVCF